MTQLKSSMPKSLLYFLLALALVRGILYASLVPPWQAPDEPAQFERVRASLTAREWNSVSADRLPWYEDLARSLFTFNTWDFVDAPRPVYDPEALLSTYFPHYREVYGGLYGNRLAYAVIGWPLFLARGQAISLQLYLVRLNTVLMNVGVILLAYLTVRTLFPQDRFLALGVPLLILFNPQHTHMLSTVNNGNLAELLATAALYFTVRAIVRGFTWRNGLAIGGLTAAAMWTKATAYFLPVAMGTLILFYLWRYRRYWYWILPGGAVLAGAAFFLAPPRLRLLSSWAWNGFIHGDFYLDPVVPRDLFRSFWAWPGQWILPLHPFWYWVWAGVCLLALVGLGLLVVTHRRLVFLAREQPRLQALAVLAVAIVVSVGVLLAWDAVSNSIVYRQGRSIFPVIVPVSLFLMLGWRQLMPRRWRGPGLLALTLALFLFDSLVLFNYITPAFYSRY